MTNDSDKLSIVQNLISEFSVKHDRNSAEITLIGASKTRNSDVVKEFFDAGLINFGENYLEEALVKIKQLEASPIIWHYIGSIQSNKTKSIAQHFDWVHTIEREKIARRLNQHIEEFGKEPLNVLIQVNIDKEDSKSGVYPENAFALAESIRQCEHLRLRGLMSIPKARDDFHEQCEVHKRLLDLKLSLEEQLDITLDTISAGMSADMEAAIAAGSTHIRVGTDLFGKRD